MCLRLQFRTEYWCYANSTVVVAVCLQCFDAVGWVAGKASSLQKTEWWGAGVDICLEQVADLHMAQLMPLPFTVSRFSKIHIGFTFLVPVHLCVAAVAGTGTTARTTTDLSPHMQL